MSQWIQWLIYNWLDIAIPLIAFLACYVVALWLRGVAYRAFDRWIAKARWQGSKLVVETTRSPFLHAFLLLGAYIAIQVSILAPAGKTIAGRAIASLFVLSVAWVAVRLSGKLIRFYFPRMRVPEASTTMTVNIARITAIVIGVLIVLDVWGVPTTPILCVSPLLPDKK